MKKMIMETLVLAAFAAGQANAAPITLDSKTTVSATYQGSADGMLGLDANYQPVAGSNTTRIDTSITGFEFMSSDYLFAFDFTADGLLSIYNNMPLPVPAAGEQPYHYSFSFSFDFGTTLPAQLASLTLADLGAASGTPVFSVVNGHSISVDLSGLAWSGDYTPLTVQLGSAGAGDVPEPASLALLLLGAAGIAAVSRRRA